MALAGNSVESALVLKWLAKHQPKSTAAPGARLAVPGRFSFSYAGSNSLDWPLMTVKFLRASLVLLLSACSPHSARTPSVSPENPAKSSANPTAEATATKDVAALFNRELDALPPLVEVSGRGWATKAPGRNATVKAGTVAGSEELDFAFESSGSVECIVFSEAFDPGAYVGNIVEELKKSLEVVGFTPTRFTVEQEIPAYFASVLYHKRTPAGVLAGQLKLAIGLHVSRPIVCLHDVPGYTVTFESAARAVFANYQVKDDTPPVAVTIGVARVGTLPIGFTRESTSLLDAGRTQFTSISTQIVPRSPTELMISDEAEVIVVAKSKLVEAHFIQGDLHGEKMNLTLAAGSGGTYQVSGTLGSKPTEATIKTKSGLPSPEATSLRLKQEMGRKKAFRFTQPEFHPSLDPTAIIEVSYVRTQEDKTGVVHVGLGQLELLATLDEQGEQLKSEMKAGSQTIVFERMYHRDDRASSSRPASPKKSGARQP